MNVRVENALSDLLNWNTFAVEGTSHPVETTRQNNLVTFRFDNIDLPATTQDAVASHGWIAYRIKPGSNFIQGTTIENNAAIFFDFNAPVQTNTVTTELAPLSIADPKTDNFVIYPNPAGEFVRVTSTNTDSEIMVHDITGRHMPVFSRQEGTETWVNIAPLPPGVYTVKIHTKSGITTRKLLKR
ncbi:T9SS type A sorting domain-containing protein [Flavobacterium sp. N1718]|uniref:T9SS type A sorting domain-containing protein n=1 Tax=Flavobacterium sp. N1718 TaxID=2986822 RepID=UPI00222536F3|nr:T9SS type A sorting domain-containing protein [Flavobacterium sp. N1718]